MEMADFDSRLNAPGIIFVISLRYKKRVMGSVDEIIKARGLTVVIKLLLKSMNTDADGDEIWNDPE